ncbi:MAG: Ig-like domain-containing protein [Bacteroidales bacterium]|nr:Ig-like domain-containing protein [Bacteroidales bacterium]
MIEYQDITNTVKEKGNMGGAWEDVYFAPKDDFAEFATRPPESGDREFTTMNKLIIGQDRLKPGKKLYKAYNTLEKVSLTAPRQGEIDGISHKPTLELFNPGLTSEALAMLLIPNQSWIFYVRTGEQMFRVGGEQFAAKLSAEGEVGTGKTTADLKGNSMIFTTYDVGFPPEVVDIDAILAMRNAVDEGLTVVYAPAHGDTLVLVDADPTITFGEAVVNADTLAAFTNQEIEAIITLKSLDVDGNEVANKPFTAAILGNVVTITPTSNFAAATIYQVKFDATKVLSADAKGRVNGSNYAKFTTA